MSEKIQKISNALEKTLKAGLKDVYFAENSIFPPILAFAVHFLRISIPVEGNYSVYFEQCHKAKKLILKPGTALVVPPNCWDKPDWTTNTQVLHILIGKMNIGLSHIDSDGTGEKQLKVSKTAFKYELDGPAQKIIDTIFELRNTDIPYPAFPQLVYALVAYFANKLDRLDNRELSSTASLSQQIRVYLQENFQYEITREYVAKQFNISPGHLSRVFKTDGQMKFCKYLNHVRVARAKFLLRKFNLPLKQIVNRCGFSDTVYFCRVFKKITHKTPTEYRQQK
jgi:AraC-like DNA-binding protein